MEGREHIFKLLESERDSIRRLGVNRLGLFGSFVRGEQRPDSDVDILVEMDGMSFGEYVEILDFLEDLFDRKVDLVPVEDIKPLLRKRILREVEYVPNL
ncbi:MAG: nucleotidyltransferase family protein [Pyrinomonadaceae bacterium]|nr:nucleotidyltransferase family protein [Pyrinomonadaceae bacterium]